MELTKKMIKELRTALDESQETFAKRFGVNRGTIGDWEAQGARPRQPTLEKLEKLYAKTLPQHTKSARAAQLSKTIQKELKSDEMDADGFLTPMGIRALRERLGETKNAFGARFGISGTAVGHWEKRNSKPKLASRENLKDLHASATRDTTPRIAVRAEPTLFLAAAKTGKGGRHAVSVTEVHETLAEFHEFANKDYLIKALDFIAKKHGISRYELRSMLTLLLYLIDEMRPAPTMKQLLSLLSGHEDPG